VPLVSQVAEYIIGAGGKRLRPQVLLLAARATGHKGSQHHALAAMIELIHTSTLLHDDVVDESTLRRGRDTANARFGNAASVLVGDFLYTRAFQMMVSANSLRIMEVMADATNIIAEGEVLQLMNIGNADLDEAGYLQVIHYKTAKLFEAAARLGAILGDAPDAIETSLANYGLHLGAAFQIVDDILDYSGKTNEIGKNLGDDLAEGKTTLPLIHVLNKGNPDQIATVRTALQTADRTLLPQVLQAIAETGALEYSYQIAQAETKAAQACLAQLPDTPQKQALAALARLAIDRTQ
jgi:octaprenyl-diphosphate synthase